MKVYFKIIFFLSATFTLATDLANDEEIWINGDSFYEYLKHKKESTIYFDKWNAGINQFLEDGDYYVAIQLHESFDPLPEDRINLPSLTDLAAVADQELRNDYFQFLESFGRTNGIHHLILPDTAGLSGLEKEVIERANDYSPFYFLHKSSLSSTIPDSKRKYKQISEPTIWIVNQGIDHKKLNRWKDKKKQTSKDSFYAYLRESKGEAFIPAFELPETLAKSVFLSSVVAVDPQKQFPLKVETLTYLGSDLKLRDRLSQYVKVLNYRVSGVQSLVDTRSYNGVILEGDIILQNGLELENFTSLSLPEISVPNIDIEICKMLFGATAVVGRSIHPDSRQIESSKYLGYSDPEATGLNADHLHWVDSLAIDAIKKSATPGIQLAIIKNGDVVIERSYGHFTYDSLKRVDNNTVYDIASVTKVVATLPAIGLLLDQGLIHLDDSISKYLPEFVGSNKSGVTIRQLLAHHSGLRSYIPFWKMAMTGDRLDAFYYKTQEDKVNDVRSYGLEPHPLMLDSLKSFIVQSNLIKKKDTYHYSDLGFMILHVLVEEVTGQPFDEFLATYFYNPMGLSSTKFNPLRHGISARNIAPTEYDDRYRNYQVWGEVHDRNALVFGGIAGHAGLFSTAIDLAKMMSMFMNEGFFGGKRYLSRETVSLFNNRFFPENRRGLGWDKRDFKNGNLAVSDKSFGHTGFTGTMVWADPEYDLIYVFLSNRIYPDASNQKLMKLRTRDNIHSVIYQALEKRG